MQENSDRLTPKYGLDPSTIIDKMRKLKNEEIQALKQVTRLQDRLAPREKETFEEFYKNQWQEQKPTKQLDDFCL